VVAAAALGIGLGGTREHGFARPPPSPVAPADYSFAIWALIYAGMVAFAVP
jgi:hypothetical protein